MTKTPQGGIVHGKHHRLTGDIAIRAPEVVARADDEAPTERLAAIDGADDHTRPNPINTSDTETPADTSRESRGNATEPGLTAATGGNCVETSPAATSSTGTTPPTRTTPPPMQPARRPTSPPTGAPAGRPNLMVGGVAAGGGVTKADPDASESPSSYRSTASRTEPVDDNDTPAVSDTPTGSDVDEDVADEADEPTSPSKIHDALGSIRMRVAAGIALAIMAVGLVGWGASAVADSGPDEPSPPAGVSVPVEPPAFGDQVTVATGWTITVSEPTESKADLPNGVARAVQFEVTLTNGTDRVRDSGIWTVRATSGGRPVELIDDAESETDVPSRTVRPGASLSFTVTVPTEKKETEVQLEFLTGDAEPVLFVGQA